MQSDAQRFQRELNDYQAILKENMYRLVDAPWLDKQITFWMASTQFLITELEIWDQIGDRIKYEKAVRKVRGAMDNVNRLILELTREQ